MDSDDFHDVYDANAPSVQKVPGADEPGKRATGAPGPGPSADPIDNAGLDGGSLECSVGQPIKENDGTKDAYVSYLVTTNVCFLLHYMAMALTDLITRPTSHPSRSR
jgi:sorting nexin-4